MRRGAIGGPTSSVGEGHGSYDHKWGAGGTACAVTAYPHDQQRARHRLEHDGSGRLAAPLHRTAQRWMRRLA